MEETKKESINLAIVHDDFIQYGGAEKLVAALAEKYPQAPIYTSLYDPEILKKLGIKESRVVASFMQKLPLKSQLYKAYFFLYPFAFEHLSSAGQFDSFDSVFCSTARFAHGLVLKPHIRHIVYINSPARMWWEPEKYFSSTLMRKLFTPFRKWLQFWDKVATSRVGFIVANSKYVAAKIEKSYERKADFVVYPFVDDYYFIDNEPVDLPPYFLIVSRLIDWKRIDIAVRAFKKFPDLGNLVVVGNGPKKSHLQALSKGAGNIIFRSQLTKKQLNGYYKSCQALIVTQEEDFGITPLEAMQFGKPVIAFGKGGVIETVQNKKHGLFFNQQTPESLAEVVKSFTSEDFDSEKLRQQAKKFSKERFLKEIEKVIKS